MDGSSMKIQRPPVTADGFVKELSISEYATQP